MKFITKWKQSKESVTDILLQDIDEDFENYYEPFVGGGALYLRIEANHYFINDICTDLMELYHQIQDNPKFFFYAEELNDAWRSIETLCERLLPEIVDIMHGYLIESEWPIECQNRVSNILRNTSYRDVLSDISKDEYSFYLELRFRMYRVYVECRLIDENQWHLQSRIKTAFKRALHQYFCTLYNCKKDNIALKTALFMFIMDKSAGGQFSIKQVESARDKKILRDEFCVGYAGKFADHHSSATKLDEMQAEYFKKKLSDTSFSCMDFLEFLRTYPPHKDDFIFVDPPLYGKTSKFGKYIFTDKDHQRLANYLRRECHCKWMLVVKDTPRMRELYLSDAYTVRQYRKKDHQKKSDKHYEFLVIMNY